MYPKSLPGDADISNDDIILEMAVNLNKRLVNIIDVDQAHFTIMSIDDKGRLPSLSMVLLEEIKRFNKLLNAIHNSLSDLCKAIKGLIEMSAELDEVYLSFTKNYVRYNKHNTTYSFYNNLQK